MNAVPPKISRVASANLWFVGTAIGLAVLGGGAVVYFFNPTTHGFYPLCQFHRLTGLNCPGCGATRALYALLHGDFVTALRDNALFVLGSAGLGLRGIWLAVAKTRRQPAGELFPKQWAWPLLIIAVVFAVLRNLPEFWFLSPA